MNINQRLAGLERLLRVDDKRPPISLDPALLSKFKDLAIPYDKAKEYLKPIVK